MVSRRERYERANMRGGLGVRKRLSEESLRTSYRLNGVRTGSAVARAHDKYFADFTKGYDLGVIVRKTASIVQVRWIGNDDITSYSQGDARYEVDRGRWRILGVLQGSPLDPDNPLVDALTKLRLDARIEASANAGDTPLTEETEDMAKEISNAAAERAAAQKAVKEGSLQKRDTYTAKQVAIRCGTDSKTMRKFFRSNHSTVEAVGQGGRYEFDAKDLPKIKKEFDAWQKKSKSSRAPSPKPMTKVVEEMAEAIQENVNETVKLADTIERLQQEDSFGDDGFDPEDNEPTPEELESIDKDLDDLDADDVD